MKELATAGGEHSGASLSVWRMAANAYRTIAGNARAAIMVSVMPAVLMLIGTAAISWMAFGAPFLEAEDAEHISGWGLVAPLPQMAVYALGSLIAFVPWLRVILGLQPPAWVAFLPQYLKAAPDWFLAWVIMPLVAGLAVSIVLIPVMLIVLIFMPEGGGGPEMAGYLMAGLILVAITFANARFLLRAALLSADLAQSDMAPRVLGSWVRAAGALILAVVPLTGVGLLVAEVFQSTAWVVHVIAVIDAALFTLIQGAVCATVIRAAGVPEPKR